jgi:hypothetical protein
MKRDFQMSHRSKTGKDCAASIFSEKELRNDLENHGDFLKWLCARLQNARQEWIL